MPEPSRLVLLEQLQSIQSGTKVRFLACVHEYNVQHAQLILRDKYPATGTSVPTTVVKLESVLENVHHELLEVGAWVNIVGYVRSRTVALASEVGLSIGSTSGNHPKVQANATYVDASMIWSAGPVKLDRYQNAVREYQTPLASERQSAS